MSNHDNRYLIEQLINNKLSREELDEFLAGLHNAESSQAYSGLLEAYFQGLINQQSDFDSDAKQMLLPPSPGQKDA